MRRIFIFASLLLLVGAVQVAAQSDVIDASAAAASCVRCHATSAPSHFGPGAIQSTMSDMQASSISAQAQSAQPSRFASLPVFCVLRC
jgi:hypothetical protein